MLSAWRCVLDTTIQRVPQPDRRIERGQLKITGSAYGLLNGFRHELWIRASQHEDHAVQCASRQWVKRQCVSEEIGVLSIVSAQGSIPLIAAICGSTRSASGVSSVRSISQYSVVKLAAAKCFRSWRTRPVTGPVSLISKTPALLGAP